MLADFLTALERQRYQTLPAELREEDLHASCWLTPADRQVVEQQCRDSNRLGSAVQLGVMRLLSHLPVSRSGTGRCRSLPGNWA